ncbi:MAG: phospholipid carrier-dependent glycosyltransferase [Myxococcota bacterium]|jgi:hypothetical protein|nr:phospholipid carrier-dependent glycosyltransferase [Myxococcota bacterium]
MGLEKHNNLIKDFFSQNLYSFALILIFFLGATLRLWNITNIPLWTDEYATWWEISAESLGEVINRTFAVDCYTPLYPLLLKPLSSFFDAPTLSTRIISLSCGLALPPAAYYFIRSIGFSARSAIWAALLIAIHPHFIFHSQNSRSYSFALFLSLFSFITYIQWLKRPNFKSSAVYIISTSCIVYIQFFFALTWAVQILHYCLLQYRPTLKQWLQNNIVIALLHIGAIINMFWLYQNRMHQQWLPTKSLRFFYTALSGFIHPLLLALLIFGLILMWKTKSLPLQTSPTIRPFPLIALWFFLPILFCFLASGVSEHSYLENRYALLCAFAPVFLYAILLDTSHDTWKRLKLILGLLVVSHIGIFQLLPAYQKQGVFALHADANWAKAMEQISTNAHHNDVIFYDTGLFRIKELADQQATKQLRDFTEFPLRAHGNQIRAKMVPFFYDGTEESKQYLLKVFEEYKKQDRIWVLGSIDSKRLFNTSFGARIPYKIRSEHHYGSLHVNLFQQNP